MVIMKYLHPALISLLLIAVMLVSPAPYAAASAMTMGDVNGDGSINPSDALYVLQYAVGLCWLNEAELPMEDVSADNQVNPTDALHILQYSVQLIDGFDNRRRQTLEPVLQNRRK